MPRRFIFSAISILFLLLLAGCAKPSDEIVANSAPSLVMLEGKLYVNYGDTLHSSIKLSEAQILGHISSVIPGSQTPSKDQEANFPAAQDAPYARCPLEECPDCIVVFYAHQWYIFHPVDS